ncbi:MAG: zinc-ribbon domain-containing protein [Desulfatiglandaceae bacterium]
MQIICPSCNTAYRIPKNRIPWGKTGAATCKKCGYKMIIHGDGGVPINNGPASETPTNSPVAANRDPEVSSVRRDGIVELNLIREFPELNEITLEKYELGSIFFKDKKGGYKGRRNREVAKILKSIHLPLGKMLEDGERVSKICWGTAYYPLEIIFGNGFLTMIYNRYAMAATDRRLLFINTNYRLKKPTHYFFQLPFQDIKKVKRGIFGGSLTFYKLKGRRRHFTGVRSRLSKGFKQYVSEKIGIGIPDKPKRGQPEELCPSCFSPLEQGLVRCTHCWAGFKVPRKALLRSLILPGLGDYYLGHRSLGILEMMGSAIVWFVIVSLLLTGAAVNMAIAAVLLLWVNGSDGLFTYYMAKKGYMLEYKTEDARFTADPKSPFDTQTRIAVEGV